MNAHFSRQLEGVFSRIAMRELPRPQTSSVTPVANATRRRQKWFAEFAPTRLMPLLTEAAAAAKRHSLAAESRLLESDGHLSAELVIVPPDLPAGARPPRLSFYAGKDEYPLMVEYTGTFPGIGIDGGCGAEVEFDPIHSDLVEEKILDFVSLATAS